MVSFERLRYPDAVSAVITNDNGEILLVKINFKEGRWQLPGGIVEKSESPWQACIRNTVEEIGIEITIDSLIGIFHRPAKDANLFVFKAHSNTSEIKLSEEISQCQFYARDTLPTPMAEHTHERITSCMSDSEVILRSQYTTD